MIYLGVDGGIPDIERNEIISAVEAVLAKCYWDGLLPVDAEFLCDVLGISIVPISDLSMRFYVDAFISADFKTIYVDEDEFRKESARYKFSVAHELGHFVLHRGYYPNKIGGLNDWSNISSDLLSEWAENQANYFAGNLLVPEDRLVQVLNDMFGGSFVRNYWKASPMEIEMIFAKVSKQFGVSKQVILHRMRDVFPGVGSDICFIINNTWRANVHK